MVNPVAVVHFINPICFLFSFQIKIKVPTGLNSKEPGTDLGVSTGLNSYESGTDL